MNIFAWEASLCRTGTTDHGLSIPVPVMTETLVRVKVFKRFQSRKRVGAFLILMAALNAIQRFPVRDYILVQYPVVRSAESLLNMTLPPIAIVIACGFPTFMLIHRLALSSLSHQLDSSSR